MRPGRDDEPAEIDVEPGDGLEHGCTPDDGQHASGSGRDLGQRRVRRVRKLRKLIEHGHTAHIGAGITGAALGIIGNQVVARYKLTVGNRINSATLIADARHSWLDALSSAGALAGLVGVAFGQFWGDPVAGLAVTGFICHVGYEVTKDVVRRLADTVDPEVIRTAEAAAGSVPGVVHAHARARWTGRTLRVEIEG